VTSLDVPVTSPVARGWRTAWAWHTEELEETLEQRHQTPKRSCFSSNLQLRILWLIFFKRPTQYFNLGTILVSLGRNTMSLFPSPHLSPFFPTHSSLSSLVPLPFTSSCYTPISPARGSASSRSESRGRPAENVLSLCIMPLTWRIQRHQLQLTFMTVNHKNCSCRRVGYSVGTSIRINNGMVADAE